MDLILARKKWHRHKSNARSNGVCELPFDAYILKLKDAGITPDMVGRGNDDYHLSRYTDSGDYTLTSCRFITARENQNERRKNGGLARGHEKLRGRTKETCSGRASCSEKQKGKKISQTSLAKRSAVVKGRTAETHEYLFRMAEKKSKPFAFISPDGILHAGRNLSKFCKENNLLEAGMGRLLRGEIQKGSYKGWILPTHDIEITK